MTDKNMQSQLERQRAEIEATLRGGWLPMPSGKAEILDNRLYYLAQKVIRNESSAPLDPSIIQAVRNGAQPGDALPPTGRKPFIENVPEDFQVIVIEQEREQSYVAVLFSHVKWPGYRFGYKFSEPGSTADRYGPLFMLEHIETGAIDRLMEKSPRPGEKDTIWIADFARHVDSE